RGLRNPAVVRPGGAILVIRHGRRVAAWHWWDRRTRGCRAESATPARGRSFTAPGGPASALGGLPSSGSGPVGSRDGDSNGLAGPLDLEAAGRRGAVDDQGHPPGAVEDEAALILTQCGKRLH